jgi:hypothetical protein
VKVLGLDVARRREQPTATTALAHVESAASRGFDAIARLQQIDQALQEELQWARARRAQSGGRIFGDRIMTTGDPLPHLRLGVGIMKIIERGLDLLQDMEAFSAEVRELLAAGRLRADSGSVPPEELCQHIDAAKEEVRAALVRHGFLPAFENDEAWLHHQLKQLDMQPPEEEPPA